MVESPLCNLVLRMYNYILIYTKWKIESKTEFTFPCNCFELKKLVTIPYQPSWIHIDNQLITKYPLLFLRAEKEKSQYFSELNDLRASTNHLANDKVEESFPSKELDILLRKCKQKKKR